MSSASNIASPQALSPAALPKGRSLWADAWARMQRDRFAMICLGIVVFYFLVAVGVKLGFIASSWGESVPVPAGNVKEYHPPSFSDWRLWAGTDIFGRSVLLKTIYGCNISMTVGILSSRVFS